jgi:hypothetical protein
MCRTMAATPMAARGRTGARIASYGTAVTAGRGGRGYQIAVFVSTDSRKRRTS